MDKIPLPTWMINLFGMLLLIFMVLLDINQYKSVRGEPQTLSVTATGKADSTPDVAIVTIGVISESASPVQVKNDNNKKMNQAIEFIKQQGVDAKDIQTSGFYISPKYNYTNNQRSIVGYQANQTITVKVRRIDQSVEQLEKVVDGSVMNGANEIQGIAFTLNDDQALSQLARKQAIDNAIKKAKEIADESGLKLGRLVNVVTTTGGNAMPMSYQSAMFAKAVAPNIQAGSQEITESVTVMFQVY